jgi:conflict system pore-forming effector with SLATT domain
MSDESSKGTEQAVWTPKIEQLLQDWRNRVYAAQAAYYQEAERLRRRQYQLGIPTVIVSSLVGTAVFADLDKVTTLRWVVGSVSILAAVLASLQTFLKFGENATLHGVAADWFAAIRREIEELLVLPVDLRGNPKSCLDAIRQEINKAGQKSPELRETLWSRIARRFAVEEPPRQMLGAFGMRSTESRRKRDGSRPQQVELS